MSADRKDRFEGLEHFYRQVYAPAVREVRPAGRLGAAMILAEQDAGDWSDAATPDLAIGVPLGLHAPATLDMGGGRFRAGGFAGDAFVISPPQFATTVLVEGPHAVRVLAIPYARLLSLAGEDSGLPPDGDFGRLHVGAQRSPEVVQMLNRLWVEGVAGSPGGALWADGVLLQLAGLLLRLRDGGRRATRAGLADWQLRRACELMDANLAEGPGIGELAAALGLSASHFGRAFKARTGIAPHAWLAQRRIERARELLGDPRLSLTEIAQRVGFGGQSAFGACFKRVTGLSPSSYRRAL